uniref:VPS9 domain-containing protein n=2 Tax=Kalanchoe fedtschenkoi TaxID=63787 RepID=A0A7N0VAI1_KALFE
MENAEAFEASTAPLSLHDFFERMRQPAAAEFVKAIKSFVVSFSNKAPNHERDSAAVQDFLSNMERAFREHPLWAGCSVEELDCAGEGLEKYVMTKLFTHVFASLPDDLEVDRQLSDKMALLQQFIRPENLDIKPNFRNEASWLANPPQLHSNLLYIQRYRHHPRLVAEYAYYFTNMLSVESFITNINAKALSMDETEFEMNMESARALNLGLSADTSDMSDQNEQNLENTSNKEAVEIKQGFSNFKTDHVTRPPPSVSKSGKIELRHTKAESSIRKIPSMSDLENKGAFMLLNENRLSRVFQEYPYLFSQVGDLTLDDVESLLNNYKQLVFKYVSLAKGKGSEPLPPPFISMSNSQSQRATPADAERESIEEPVAEKTNNRNEANSWTDEGSIEVSQVPELNSPDYKMPEVSSAQVEADHDHDNS